MAGKIVVDASVVLAFLNREQGAYDALAFFSEALISVVNIAEIVQVGIRLGRDVDEDLDMLKLCGLEVVEADTKVARLAGELEATTRDQDISLADRFCIALGIERDLPLLTADRIWTELKLPVEVRQLR